MNRIPYRVISSLLLFTGFFIAAFHVSFPIAYILTSIGVAILYLSSKKTTIPFELLVPICVPFIALPIHLKFLDSLPALVRLAAGISIWIGVLLIVQLSLQLLKGLWKEQKGMLQQGQDE